MNISFNLSAVVYITDIFNSKFWNRINGVEAFLVSATLPEEGNHIDLAGHKPSRKTTRLCRVGILNFTITCNTPILTKETKTKTKRKKPLNICNGLFG